MVWTITAVSVSGLAGKLVQFPCTIHLLPTKVDRTKFPVVCRVHGKNVAVESLQEPLGVVLGMSWQNAFYFTMAAAFNPLLTQWKSVRTYVSR